MSIGEPQHEPPPFVLETLKQNLHRLGSYPATIGLIELRTPRSRSGWSAASSSGANKVNPETMVLPVNGTREALFAFVQAVVGSNEERAWWRCPTRSIRSTKAQRCSPARSPTS